MADRVLTWFVSGALSNSKVGTDIGPAYRLDANYRPIRVWAHARGAPSGAPAVFDIRIEETLGAAKTSIFSAQPRLFSTAVVTNAPFNRNGDAMMVEGSVVTCDLISVSATTPGTDLSISLELKRVSSLPT